MMNKNNLHTQIPPISVAPLSYDRPVVVKLDGKNQCASIPRPTDTEMQREYDYILAENLTRNLLAKGMISLCEFDKIMAKNRESFSPFFARI